MVAASKIKTSKVWKHFTTNSRKKKRLSAAQFVKTTLAGRSYMLKHLKRKYVYSLGEEDSSQ